MHLPADGKNVKLGNMMSENLRCLFIQWMRGSQEVNERVKTHFHITSENEEKDARENQMIHFFEIF